MQYRINKMSSLPQYMQIARSITDAIKSGQLAVDSKLPSVRKLAQEASISHVTADKVFRELEKNGLIERRHGSGSYVIYESPFINKDKLSVEDVKNEFQMLRNTENFRSLLVNLLSNTSYNCRHNFSYALINPDLLNAYLPSLSELTRGSNEFDLPRKYGEIKGYHKLREALMDFYPSSYSIDEILITSGNQHGINLVAQALINTGDFVMIETPTFAGAVDILLNAQAELLPIKIYENGLDLDYIESLCIKFKPKLFFMTPNYSNPTGYCLTHKGRVALLKLAKKYNFYIVEDDHWSDFNFQEPIMPFGLMKSASSHVIYLRGFSKIIGPDTRIGALFAPEHIVDRIVRVLTLQSLGVSLLAQEYLYTLMKQGYYKSLIKKIRIDLKERSILANKYLMPLKQYGLSYDLPEGGLNYWIKLPNDINSEELLFNTLYEHGITYLPGAISDVSKASDSASYLRLNFSYLPLNNFKLGLEKLVVLIEEYIIAIKKS